jgi:hypothetical protein
MKITLLLPEVHGSVNSRLEVITILLLLFNRRAFVADMKYNNNNK